MAENRWSADSDLSECSGRCRHWNYLTGSRSAAAASILLILMTKDRGQLVKWHS